MKIGEENLSFAEKRILLGQRLLHLEDQFGLLEDCGMIRFQSGPGSAVFFVIKTAAAACPLLNKDRMAMGNKGFHAARDNGDSVETRS